MFFKIRIRLLALKNALGKLKFECVSGEVPWIIAYYLCVKQIFNCKKLIRGPSYWCSSQKAAQACGEGVSFTSQCTNRLVKYFFSFYSIKNTIPRLWHTATRSIGRSTNNLTPELKKPPGYSDGCFDGDFCIFHYYIFYWYLVFLIEVWSGD